MEESIQNFYIALEETRRQLLETSSKKVGGRSVEEVDVCDLHQSCDIVYGHIQRLWDKIPLPNGEPQQQNPGEEDVWSVMVKNCTLKAFQLIQDIYKYSTTGYLPSEPAAQATGTSKKKRSEDNVPDFDIPGQAAIARMMELTVRLSFESNDPASNLLSGRSSGDGNVKSYISPAMATIQHYTSYQNKVLRSRSKPSIAHVATIRKLAQSNKMSVAELLHEHAEINGEDDDDTETQQQQQQQQQAGDDQNDEEEKRSQTQPHAHSIDVILREASTLIHPLVLWRDGIASSPLMISRQEDDHVNKDFEATSNSMNNSIINITPNSPLEAKVQGALLQMCNDTIHVLDQESQKLAVTVGNWFLDDSPTTLTNQSAALINTTLVDNTVGEMAYICQMISRYCTFQTMHIPSSSSTDNQNKQKTNGADTSANLSRHLLEQSLHYSTMETSLAEANIQRALSLAAPVEIIVGGDVFVPSIVEDAYFISTRALERANGTLCDKAILTVGQFICELWNTESVDVQSKKGVEPKTIYAALLYEKGCILESARGHTTPASTEEQTNGGNEQESKDIGGGSGGFASALLSALDQDSIVGNHEKPSSKPKAPLSGSFLTKSDEGGIQLDTLFCSLNGIHAAASACVGLSSFFTSFLPEDVHDDQEVGSSEEVKLSDNDSLKSMVDFAKDQLVSYSRSYTRLLDEKIQNIIAEQCGIIRDTQKPPPLIASLPSAPCFHRIYYSLSQEQYSLDADTFHHTESDERIEQDYLLPLRECEFIRQVMDRKCDEGVTLLIAQNLSTAVVSLIVATIVQQRKQFSEWGSFLFSKQSQMLEHFFCGLILGQDSNNGSGNIGEISSQFHKLSQVRSILRLVRPIDWLPYAKDIGDDTKRNLTKDEIRGILGLRFSEEAISAAFPNDEYL